MSILNSFRHGLTALALFAAINANAIYKQNVPTTVTQPDGTKISCFISGDEFYNRIHDENGYTIVQNDKGYYVYAVEAKGHITASKFVVGKINPSATKGIRPNLVISKEEYQARREARNQPKPEGLKSLHLNNIRKGDNSKEITTMNNIVIFIKFADSAAPTDSESFYEGIYNTKADSSVSSYYKSVSYNQFDIHSTFYPSPSNGLAVWYTDSHKRGYYQPYNATTNTDGYDPDATSSSSNSTTYREHTLLKNAIASITVPTDVNIDINGDGYVDAVSFVIEGAQDGWNNLLWPHQWTLYSQNATINGKKVSSYTFQLQKFYNKPLNLGTLCHEMFHLLGAPDLYHYNESANIDAVGPWDVMCSTNDYPQSMGAYMKYKYGGWIESIPTIDTTKTVTIRPLTSSSRDNIYKIPSSNSATEFYVVEYRKQEGYDIKLPNQGLLVYRINTLYDGNASGPPDEIYIYRPNGTLTVEGQLSNAPFSTQMSRTAINGTTNPKPFLSDGTNGGLDLSEISAAGDTMTFKANVSYTSPSMLQNDKGYASALGTGSAFDLTAATRFTSNDLSQHTGKYINTVLVYIKTANGTDVVNNETIKIWKGGNSSGAGSQIYSSSISSTIKYDQWYSHTVANAISIEANTEYWIGYSASATSGHPFCVDAGPRVVGKGLWSLEGTSWQEINQDCNWCIRAVVSASNTTDIDGLEMDKSTFTMYPNPATTSITVEGGNQASTLQIFSVTGSLVKEMTIQGTSKVDVSDLNRGVYIVKLNGRSSKLIKR